MKIMKTLLLNKININIQDNIWQIFMLFKVNALHYRGFIHVLMIIKKVMKCIILTRHFNDFFLL